MSGGWGGAQWVLATWMVVILLFPVSCRVAGFASRSGRDWGLWYATKVIDTVVLTAVLAWGGFWS